MHSHVGNLVGYFFGIGTVEEYVCAVNHHRTRGCGEALCVCCDFAGVRAGNMPQSSMSKVVMVSSGAQVCHHT